VTTEFLALSFDEADWEWVNADAASDDPRHMFLDHEE
jgi:hypothetical protein